MQPDELAWIDSVPAPPARGKQVRIGEHEWTRAPSSARLTARFWINSTEVSAVLVEHETPDGRSTTQPPQPRVRVGGRSYLLFVQAPA